jgi:hypothetical protein
VKQKNAILFSKVDREDGWVRGGIVFKVNNTNFYEDSYNEIKEQLESEEVINYIIEKNCLLDDLFDGNKSFKFKDSSFYRSLCLVFENDEGYRCGFYMTADYVYVV